MYYCWNCGKCFNESVIHKEEYEDEVEIYEVCPYCDATSIEFIIHD